MIETNPLHIGIHLGAWIKRMAEVKPQIVKAIKLINDRNDNFLLMDKDKKIAYIQDKQLQNFTTSDGQNLDLRQFKQDASGKKGDLEQKIPSCLLPEKDTLELLCLQPKLPGFAGEKENLGYVKSPRKK